MVSLLSRGGSGRRCVTETLYRVKNGDACQVDAAGFMLGLARGKPLDACARLGGLAAAEVISHYGPRPQVSLAELAAANGLS